MDLEFNLHEAQMEIMTDPARFKVVAAGRRFGKSYLSAVTLLIEALKEENDYGYHLGTDRVVYYVAPTFNQAKDILWKVLKVLGKDVIESTVENVGIMRLINGREIHIKGSDRPDTLRGVGLSYVVLDEYASMKPMVWEEILRPTLADVKGGALFIGTPAGKNHFYKLFQDHKDDENWACFMYKSVDNPFIDEDEIKEAKRSMGSATFKQEFEASFSTAGGNVLNPKHLVLVDREPDEGSWYMTVDPAGFSEADASSSKYSQRDETAIAIVKASAEGWYVGDILHGRWNTRETALRILRAAQRYKPVLVGIEKGSLKNALMPYLQDTMRRLNTYPRIVEVSHGGQKKIERIVWALQGRLENERLLVKHDAEFLEALQDQMSDFPNPMAHDDLLDALAYIDQVAHTQYDLGMYDRSDEETSWAPLDITSGY